MFFLGGDGRRFPLPVGWTADDGSPVAFYERDLQSEFSRVAGLGTEDPRGTAVTVLTQSIVRACEEGRQLASRSDDSGEDMMLTPNVVDGLIV